MYQVTLGTQTLSHAHLAEAKLLQPSTLNSAHPGVCCMASLTLEGLRGASGHRLSMWMRDPASAAGCVCAWCDAERTWVLAHAFLAWHGVWWQWLGVG